jgi:hypothetical protein
MRKMLKLSFLEKAHWGWGCFVEDYLLLIALVSNLKPKTILEIGTSTGLGAVVLAYASSLFHDGAHVTTIDVDQRAGGSNLHLIPGIEKHIEFIEGNSNEILPELEKNREIFDLVFIDGSHEYTQARRDWDNTQKLTSTWALHDTTQFTGLQRLVQEIRQTNLYDVFQFISAPGYRKYPEFTREHFITGMTLVQHRSNLDVLPSQAHRDDYQNLLSGHTEREVPGL